MVRGQQKQNILFQYYLMLAPPPPSPSSFTREKEREKERERERKNHPTTTNRWANSSHLNLTVKTVTVAGKSPEEEQQLIKNDVHRLLVSKPRNIFGQEISTV